MESLKYRYSIRLEDYNASNKLDINEYNLQHPPEFYNMLFDTLLEPKCITHYSNMLSDTTIRLYKNIARENNLPDKNILITSGSDTALEYIATCLFTMDTNLLYLTPNYSYLVDYLKQHKHCKFTPIEFDIFTDNYKLSLYLEQCTLYNSVVYISNPNNPTGLCVDKTDIELCFCKYNNTTFIIDEAYIEFYGMKHSMCDLISKYPNIYIIRTFSKAYGIAGLRLGYILSQQQNIIHIHNNAFNEASLTNLSICAGNYVLENVSYYNKNIEEINTIKSYFLQFLDKNNIRYIPTHANFVSLYIGKNATDFVNNLKQSGIIIRNKTTEVNMSGFVRISIGSLRQIEMVCDYISKCVNECIF